MATTVSVPTSPIGFEDLPLEIQREILLKYFEGSCTATIHLRKVEGSHLAFDYKLSKEAQIGLPSKHLFNETLLAIKSTPGAVVVFPPEVSVWDLRSIEEDSPIMEPAKNITTIHAQHFFYDIGFAPYQRIAPNLRSIVLPAEDRKPFHSADVILFLHASTLLDVVEGYGDTTISSLVRERLIDILSYWTPGWQFNGVCLTFSFCFAVRKFWMEDAPVGTELRGYDLVLSFENTEEQTRIVSKYFMKTDPMDYASRVEGTKEVVDRLTELSQEDLDKAAEELWYLESLPVC